MNNLLSIVTSQQFVPDNFKLFLVNLIENIDAKITIIP